MFNTVRDYIEAFFSVINPNSKFRQFSNATKKLKSDLFGYEIEMPNSLPDVSSTQNNLVSIDIV